MMSLNSCFLGIYLTKLTWREETLTNLSGDDQHFLLKILCIGVPGSVG